MPRRETPFIPDQYYHFYNRGNNLRPRPPRSAYKTNEQTINVNLTRNHASIYNKTSEVLIHAAP
jgi:hypothetical protein